MRPPKKLIINDLVMKGIKTRKGFHAAIIGKKRNNIWKLESLILLPYTDRPEKNLYKGIKNLIGTIITSKQPINKENLLTNKIHIINGKMWFKTKNYLLEVKR